MAGSTAVPWLVAGGLALGIAALAGGGGGGGDRNDSRDGGRKDGSNEPASSADGSGPGQRSDPASFETTEYKRDYTLDLIGASARFAEGGTGFGTLLSVFDTGADVGHIDLAPNIAHSWSYYTRSSDVTDRDGHGTQVAAKLAAAKNDFGMHGVAFDAKLAIFQGFKQDGAPMPEGGILNAWADAQRQSIDLGARAINHSWGLFGLEGNEQLITEFDRDSLARYLGTNVMTALAESADADMVTVFAAGNGGQAEVSALAGIPALYPELGGHMLAAAAVDSDSRIADFSNRCGIAAEYCLVAPGVSVYTALSSEAGYSKNAYGFGSGTSYAAPIVAAAVSVLASNFPELTGEEISRILRDTATDLGKPGIDPVYGNGLINLEKAIVPQGTLVVLENEEIDGGHTALDESWIAGNSVMGSALSISLSGSELMVADQYLRGYGVDLGDVVAVSRRDISAVGKGLRSFTWARGSSMPATDAPSISISPTGVDVAESAVWADARAFGSPYAGLVDAQHLVFAGPAAGGTLRFKSALGNTAESYAAAEFEAGLSGGNRISFEIGQLAENGAMLGTAVTGAFGADIDSRTIFGRVGGEARIGPATSLLVSASMGRTSFSSSGVLARGEDIVSSALGLGLHTKGLLAAADNFSIGISRPLSIDGGRMVIDAPIAMASARNGNRSRLIYRDRTEIDLSASEAAMDVQVGYSHTAFGGRIGLGGVWRPDTGAGSGFALSGGFTLAF